MCKKDVKCDKIRCNSKWGNIEKYEERNSQFEANIAPHINEYDILLESLFDYSLSVMSDHLSIL